MSGIVCPKCEAIVPEHSHFCPSCGAPVSQAEETLPMKGRILNQKYEILEMIAEGGMAYIFKAQHIYLEDLCAVKIIKKSLSNKEEMHKRFRQEAKLTRRVARKSPYVISIYDFGIDEEIGFFYVMELLDGYSFTDLISDPNNLPAPQTTARFVCQICEALAAVHDEGLVHRDIKPDNIFIHKRADDGKEMVKLLDFGIARPIYKSNSAMLTSYGRVMGTPEYMSPEQCKGPTPQQYERGESHLDGRSDIYSLGVLLYQCLTGSVPFPMPEDGSAMAIHQVMAGHVMKQPTSPLELRSEIPPALAEVTLKALAKKPEDRFQTMLEFRDAILQSFPELHAEFGLTPQEIPASEQLSTIPSLSDTADFSAENPSETYYQNSSDSLPDNNFIAEKTALDVQLPPELLKEAQNHWGGENIHREEPISLDDLEAARQQHPQEDVSWQGNSENSSEFERGDFSKTVATPFDPNFIDELRKKAKESLDIPDEPAPSRSLEGPTQPDQPPPLKKGRQSFSSKKFWLTISLLIAIIFVLVGFLVLFFMK